MLGAHQVAHKLPVSQISGKRDFSHLEFGQANGYVRPVTVGEITCGSALAVFTRLPEGLRFHVFEDSHLDHLCRRTHDVRWALLSARRPGRTSR